MKLWLIKWLYNSLSTREKWEIRNQMPSPSWDEVLDEEWRERERLFG